MTIRLRQILLLAIAALVMAACDFGPAQPTPTPVTEATATIAVEVAPTVTSPVVVDAPVTNASPGAGKLFPTQAAGAPAVSGAGGVQEATATSAPAPQVDTTPTPAPSSSGDAGSCAPTRPDGEGPFYVPNAPERTSVGEGHVLKGVVKSSRGCAPIANAKIEFWQVGPNAEYDDAHRATMYSDSAGAYSFESNFPPGYSGRPPHIHVKASAPGCAQLTTQFYPQEGVTEATFDLVLIPADQ